MTFLFPVKNQQGTMEGRPSAPARVSMFRRLMVRVTPAERLVGDGKERDKDEKPAASGGAGAEADVGSVALDKMVISFMEDSSAAVERPPRGRCSNCFNGNQDGSDDEDFDFLPSATAPAAPPAASGDALELLKGLVQCASTAERNLLADASRIAERCGKGSGFGRKKADIRRAVADGLRALGYDAAVCTSRWDKTPSHPARGGGGLPVGVRGGAAHQGVPRGVAGAAAAVRGHSRPAGPDRGRRGGGRAAEPSQARAPLPAVAQARVHARQVAVPARPQRQQQPRQGAGAGDGARHADIRRHLLRRVRAAVRREAEGGRRRHSRRRRRRGRQEDHRRGVADAGRARGGYQAEPAAAAGQEEGGDRAGGPAAAGQLINPRTETLRLSGSKNFFPFFPLHQNSEDFPSRLSIRPRAGSRCFSGFPALGTVREKKRRLLFFPLFRRFFVPAKNKNKNFSCPRPGERKESRAVLGSSSSAWEELSN